MPDDLNGVIYEVNGLDHIVFVNDEWDRFATANDGHRVRAGDVLNRSLWDFIADSTTRHLYKRMLARVRSGRFAQFVFRCDSPDSQRLLEMRVTRAGETGEHVRFETRTVAAGDRKPVLLLKAGQPRSEDFVRMCGWCNRLFVHGDWEEIETALPKLGLLALDPPPRLTHGICEACDARVQKEILG